MPASDLSAYADVVSRVEGVSAWIVRRTRSTQHQRYLLVDTPESERAVDRTQVDITVVHDHEGGQGLSSFTLYGDMLLDASQVEDAVFRASLQGNPPYTLPEPEAPVVVPTMDPVLASGASDALDGVQERVFASAGGESGVRLSASEIFVTRSERELLTSQGMHAADGSTSIMMEMTLIARGKSGAEQESFGSYTVRRLSDLDVEGMVARHAERARIKLDTKLPTTGTLPVVMSQGTFTPLFGPFLFSTGGSAIYRKISTLEPGASVFGDREMRGDPFTLVSDPTLPYAEQSRGFDDEGLCLSRVPVIENGVFKKIIADKQHADYLSVEATGSWHNRVLSPGTATMEELLDTSDGPVLNIVEFSWLNPDGVRGNFSTEIRLAYEHHPSGEVRVISGGSVAGNCYDAFANARYAKETELEGSYSGPRAVRFGEIRVAGA